MHEAILRQAVSTILSWPLSGHERMAGEAAAATLLRAEVGGVLGHATPEERERIRSVLQSMSIRVQEIDVEDVVTLGHWRAGGQPHHFMRLPGRTAADSVRIATDALWSDVNEAVFQFRHGAPYDKECLGRALHALQDSFSPAHVKRVKSEDGIWVIRDVFEYTAQDSKEHEKGDEKYRTGEAEQSSLSELGQATVLASQLLLSYFVQRVLGLASEAAQTRQTLEKAYLREETE
jgi:hypothetical protein